LTATPAQNLLDTALLVMRLIRGSMQEAAGTDMTVSQFRILSLLASTPEATNLQIAACLNTSPPGASRQVNGMLQQKLLLRRPSEDDRRQVLISMAPAGRRVFLKTMHYVETRLGERLYRLGPEERQILAAGLALLREAFQ
jgi:DNA-binding MarR family transcriptional regulator